MKRAIKWIGITTVLSVLVLATPTITAFTSGEQEPSLTSVTTKTLAASNISLLNPTASPSIDRLHAEGVVLNQFPGAKIRETILAQVHNTQQNSSVDRLGWLVSILPPNGIFSIPGPGGKQLQGSYRVAFVDAQTGQLLWILSGGEIH